MFHDIHYIRIYKNSINGNFFKLFGRFVELLFIKKDRQYLVQTESGIRLKAYLCVDSIFSRINPYFQCANAPFYLGNCEASLTEIEHGKISKNKQMTLPFKLIQ